MSQEICFFDIEKDLDWLEKLSKEWEGQFWSFNDVLDSLKCPGYHLIYTEFAGQVSGIVLSKDMLDAVELLFIYVSRSARRRGHGRFLLQSLIQQYSDRRRRCIFLEVRAQHTTALRLYRSEGFEDVSIRRKYYKDGEDAIVMERVLK